MLVKDCMTTHVYYIKGQGSPYDAARLMKQYEIGFLPVCSDTGQLIGVITDRDILLQCLSSDTDCNKLQTDTVDSIMSKDTVTVTPDMDIHDAAAVLAKEQIHRVPVLRGKYVVGILSISDFARKRVLLADVGDIFHAISS